MMEKDAGFTLLELIVVLLLISLIASFSVVLFTGTLSSGKLDATARSLVAAMKHARGQSAMSGEPRAVFIDLDAGLYGIEGSDGRPFPKSITVSFADPLTGTQKSGKHLIAYDPVGGIRGGAVLLATPKRSIIVRPDPIVAAASERVEKAP